MMASIRRDTAAASALTGEAFAQRNKTALECTLAMWAAARLIALCSDPEADDRAREWGDTADAMLAQRAKERED